MKCSFIKFNHHLTNLLFPLLNKERIGEGYLSFIKNQRFNKIV